MSLPQSCLPACCVLRHDWWNWLKEADHRQLLVTVRDRFDLKQKKNNLSWYQKHHNHNLNHQQTTTTTNQSKIKQTQINTNLKYLLQEIINTLGVCMSFSFRCGPQLSRQKQTAHGKSKSTRKFQRYFYPAENTNLVWYSQFYRLPKNFWFRPLLTFSTFNNDRDQKKPVACKHDIYPQFTNEITEKLCACSLLHLEIRYWQ